MTITRNVAIDEARGRPKAETLDIEESPIVSSQDEEAAHEARSSLREILSSLNPEERELLERRLLDEDSFEQIGADTGVSAPSTRKRLSRLLKRIQIELASD